MNIEFLAHIASKYPATARGIEITVYGAVMAVVSIIATGVFDWKILATAFGTALMA